MSRISKFTLIIMTIIVIGYSLAWYLVMNNVAKDYNAKYANKNLAPNYTSITQEAEGEMTSSLSVGFKFSFDKARVVGFPFRWAIALDNISIKESDQKLEFKSPVEEGYDILTQSRFIKYKGDVTIKNEADSITYRIEDINSNLAIRMILTPDLIKKLLKSDNLFELVNYAGLTKLNVANLKLYNELKTEKYLDLGHLALEIDFNKPFYYTKMDDLLNHPPQDGSFYYSVKFNENQFLADKFKNFADVFLNPFISKMNINFVNKDDLEIKLTDFSYELPSLYKFLLNGNFKADKAMNNLQVDLKSEQENGKNYLQFMKAFYNSKSFENLAQIDPKLREDLKNIQFVVNHEDNFYLKELVNRKINFDLKAELKDKQFKVENINLSSGNTSIQLKGEGTYEANGTQAKGTLFLGNFAKLVDVSSGYILLGLQSQKILDWSTESQKMIAEVGKIFLRSVADHPDSAAKDLSISYDIDANNFFNSKIGNANIGQVGQLFYRALAKGAGSKLEQLMPNIIPEKQGGMMPQMTPQVPGDQNTEALTK